jgi:formate--tetrahydrofolate ligase
MSLLDPARLKDWQIAEQAEVNMKPVHRLAHEWGILDHELLPYGRYMGKIDFKAVCNRLNQKPEAKYIDITAITPTTLGEGKSTTTIGLVQGLGKRARAVSGAIRQPSGGPTFNIKGGAAGGGLSQCIPLAPFSLGLTGDIDAVTNAHNLAMVALTSRLQHEANHGDDFLNGRNLKRLDIDPERVQMKWAIDYCAQALRNIVIGIGNKMDGYLMQSGLILQLVPKSWLFFP